MLDINSVIYYIDLFNLISGIILTIVGFFGNGLVVYILSQHKFRRIPMFRYFIISAIFQMFRIVLFWPYNVQRAYWTILSDFSCKIFQFLTSFLKNYVAWIEVVVSLDRHLSIMHPHRFHLRTKFKNQSLLLIAIFIISLGAFYPFYLYDGLYEEVTQNYTLYCNIIDGVAAVWLPFYELGISTGIPFIIIFYTTCRVGLHLIRNRKNIESKKELSLFKILLGMNLFFFFFYFQYLVFMLLYQLLPPQPLEIQLRFAIAYTICCFLSNLYCSITFIVHFLCNKQFKRSVESMFGIKSDSLKSESTYKGRTRSSRAFSVDFQ